MNSVSSSRELCLSLTCAVLLAAVPVVAQTPEFSPAEVEAYEMSREFSFICNPQRHRTLEGTQSVVRRGVEALEGTAALLMSAEGTFLILEGYDEQVFGHCLVLAYFGGALEPGDYEVRRLAMTTMEEEVGAERHSFFTMPAVRTPGENSILVTESGTLRVTSVEGAQIRGSFDFSGFAIDDGRRTGEVTWEGSFTAMAVER